MKYKNSNKKFEFLSNIYAVRINSQNYIYKKKQYKNAPKDGIKPFGNTLHKGSIS